LKSALQCWREYVKRALANADDFTKPLQDLVTEYCWARCGP